MPPEYPGESSTMKHELRSPVRSRRPEGDGKIVNTALRKSLAKNIPRNFYQYRAVKQGEINSNDSKQLFIHRASNGTPIYKSTEISPSKCGVEERKRETGGCLAATAEARVGGVSEPSTNTEESSKSQGVTILNSVPNSQSAREIDARQTVALLKCNISGNNVALPFGRSCKMSASDTAIIFHKRQCMAWCPYARLYMSGVTKAEDFSMVKNMQTQRKDSYQSGKKCSIQHSDLGGDEFINDGVYKMCSVKRLKTSPLKPAEKPVSCSFPVVTGAAASTSSHSHSLGSASRNSCARLPSVSQVGNMFTGQDKNSPLGHSIYPSALFPNETEDRPPSISSNTILQASSRSPDNSLQQLSVHETSQVQDPTSISVNLPEEARAEAIPGCSVAKDRGYFDEMIDLVLRVLFTMYIKESNNRHTKTPTAETGANELLDNPGGETLTSNYKRKSKEKVCSSWLVQRWNPEQCIKDTKPLLPVTYNAPVRSRTRPTSRSTEGEQRARSEPPKKTKKSVSHKPLNYVKKKVFVQLAGDSISPKKAEKHKDRPAVSSASPRKLGSMTNGCAKLSSKIKITPRRQKHFLKAKVEPLNIGKHVSEKSKGQKAPVGKENNARVKKIKYMSSKWCAGNDMRTAGRGLLHDNGESRVHSTAYKIEDTLMPNGTKDNRCWTRLSDEPPKSPPGAYGLTDSSPARNSGKPQATMLYHDFVQCKDCKNEKLSTCQQVFPKKCYGMENLLVDSLSHIANGKKRYTIMLPFKKTCVEELAISEKERPAVNIGTCECPGTKDDFDLSEPNKISQNQTSRYDFENNKVAEQIVGGINHQTGQDIHDKSTSKRSALNAKQGYHKPRRESNIRFKDDLKFCLPSWPMESGFHVGSSRTLNEPENNYYYNKQHTSGESDEQDEPRKHMKYNGSRLRHDCADSGDSQFSKHVNIIDLSVDNPIPNLPKQWSVFSNSPEYCDVKHVCYTDKPESNIKTAQLSPKRSIQPVLREQLYVKGNNVSIDTGRENISDFHYCSLPVNPQAINKASNGKYEQLPVHKGNVLCINKCHDKPEPKLIQCLEDDNSSDLILQEISGISLSDGKSQLSEISKGKDMLHGLDGYQDRRRVDRDGLIQPIINDFEFQNYLDEMKCQCSQVNGTPKRRNLSRWHALGHADKDLKISHRAMTSPRTLNNETGGREVSPNNTQRGIYHQTSQQTLVKDYNMKMNSPCDHKIPNYPSEIEETMFQGGEPTLAEKHFRYPPAGDAVLGNIPQSEDCYLQSTLQQLRAKNINKNKSGISSSERPRNKTNLHKAQSGANYPHLEANAYLSCGFDQEDILRNNLRFSCVHSDFDQSESVEMDNLIMSKDPNLSKQNSDSKYPQEVYPTLLRLIKNACIVEARGTPRKAHDNDINTTWVFNRDTQSNILKQTIPGDNQNYYGHPYTFIEKDPLAHRWSRWQVFSAQEEPLDLSLKKRQPPSDLISNPESRCDKYLLDVSPIQSEDTWFPLQSAPLDFSIKRPC